MRHPASELTLLFTLLACMWAPSERFALAQSAQGTPAPSNIDQSGYPRILPDNRVVFQVRAAKAVQVQINLGRMYDMQKDESSVWTVTTAPQDPRLEPTKKAVADFKSHGLKVEFASFPGGHEWQVWRKSLHDFAQWLFQQ